MRPIELSQLDVNVKNDNLTSSLIYLKEEMSIFAVQPMVITLFSVTINDEYCC